VFYLLISQIQSIKCTVNVQHDCRKVNKCTRRQSGVIRQEREVAQEKGFIIEHVGATDSFVLNLAQMRDAAVLAAFHEKNPQRFNRVTVIEEAARREIDARKAVAKAQKQAASGPPSASSAAPPDTTIIPPVAATPQPGIPSLSQSIIAPPINAPHGFGPPTNQYQQPPLASGGYHPQIPPPADYARYPGQIQLPYHQQVHRPTPPPMGTGYPPHHSYQMPTYHHHLQPTNPYRSSPLAQPIAASSSTRTELHRWYPVDMREISSQGSQASTWSHAGAHDQSVFHYSECG
jgi:hypothetical protein